MVRADDVFTQGPISSHTRRFLVAKFQVSSQQRERDCRLAIVKAMEPSFTRGPSKVIV